MERDIVIEALGNKRFKVELKDANRATMNRSYPNASDCCGVKLKQEKFCSSCMKKVEGTPARKLVKLGKSEYLIDAAALDNAMEQLEQMDAITVTAFVEEIPAVEDRYDALLYGLPAEKRGSEYRELVEILKGRTAIGKGVFRNNEFQVLLEVGNDGCIRIRKLVEESRRYDIAFDSVQIALKSPVNEQVVELEKQIIGKKSVKEFDFSEFKDTRAKIEEQVIEDFVLHGKVPQVTVVQEQKDENELARLQSLLNGG